MKDAIVTTTCITLFYENVNFALDNIAKPKRPTTIVDQPETIDYVGTRYIPPVELRGMRVSPLHFCRHPLPFK